MRRFEFYKSGDNGAAPTKVIVTELDILESYFPAWASKMEALGRSDKINIENCITDFCATQWAFEYDTFEEK